MQTLRTCPACGFDKCWVRAKICENCLFDFAKKPSGPWQKLKDLIGKVPIHVWYMRFLREKNKCGLKVADIPDDVAKSMLAVHQAALESYWSNRKEQNA